MCGGAREAGSFFAVDVLIHQIKLRIETCGGCTKAVLMHGRVIPCVSKFLACVKCLTKCAEYCGLMAATNELDYTVDGSNFDPNQQTETCGVAKIVGLRVSMAANGEKYSTAVHLGRLKRLLRVLLTGVWRSKRSGVIFCRRRFDPPN